MRRRQQVAFRQHGSYAPNADRYTYTTSTACSLHIKHVLLPWGHSSGMYLDCGS